MNSTHAMTESELVSYRQKGYVALTGRFSTDEVRTWQTECDRLLGRADLIDGNNLRVGQRVVNGVPTVEKFEPVIDISEVFRALVADERILTPLAQIYGERPALFKEKLIFKLPGMSGYTMHQDATYWHPFPYQSLISVMVAVDGATAANGAIEFFPGYHHELISPLGVMRNMSEAEIAQIDLSRGELIETRPGDILVFHSLTPHRSGSNKSDQSRRQFYPTYVASSHGDLYDEHRRHYLGYRSRQNPNEYFK